MIKFFSGLGSRKTPINVGRIQAKTAYKLSNQGWVLRSGGADGSDKFFELGVNNSKNKKRIYTVKNYQYDLDERNRNEVIEALSSESWIQLDNCKEYTQLLFKRNVCQVLGDSRENTLSKFCIYWIPCKSIYDKEAGGTRIAARICEKYNIQQFNMYNNDILDRFIKFVEDVTWEPTIEQLENCLPKNQNKQKTLFY
jgi:hypothetical protein